MKTELVGIIGRRSHRTRTKVTDMGKRRKCWYVHFEYDTTEEQMDSIAKQVSETLPPNCYLARINNTIQAGRIVIVNMGGGKSAAHEKRIAAEKNQDRDWVKKSRFVVSHSPQDEQERG